MRISDWSSDVCSSDLGRTGEPSQPGRPPGRGQGDDDRGEPDPGALDPPAPGGLAVAPPPVGQALGSTSCFETRAGAHSFSMKSIKSLTPRSLAQQGVSKGEASPLLRLRHRRSEEHTSELQSLMRISYAVF